MHASNSETLSG